MKLNINDNGQFVLFNLFIKIFMLLIIIIYIFINFFQIKINSLQISKNYIKIENNLNISFHSKLSKKINIGIYGHSIQNGGRARITTFLIDYLNTIKNFNIFLFTQLRNPENEYRIPSDIKRMTIKNNLIKIVKKNKIDILIYELTNVQEINILNSIDDLKVIFYIHSSIFYLIYSNYEYFKLVYKSLTNSKYVISIIPFENDYLFEKWGIKSILMNNFMTYEYNLIIPSDLTDNSILMIGRANDKKKRFEIGILAMEYIIEYFPECELKIISNLTEIDNLMDLIRNVHYKNNIKLIDYTLSPEIYFRKASMHFFPSITEGFPLVLSETKIYGIPNILLGIDYISNFKGGTIMIYDDKSESLAQESINILKNKEYKKNLGKESRKSMKKFKNELLLNKWIKLILSIINGNIYYQELKKKDEKLTKREALKIINNQLNLLKMRIKAFKNITQLDFGNFSFLENINI
jgi:hypothetical protein